MAVVDSRADAGVTAGRSGPAVADVASAMRGLQDRLTESQWLSAIEIRCLQFGQLSALLDHAAAAVPFYSDRLRQAGHVASRPIDDETWSRLPILSRRDVQAAGAAIISSALPADHGRMGELRTSGSTGMPVTVKVSTLAQAWFKAIVLREQLWHRRDFGLTFAVIRRYKAGIALPPDGERRARWASRAAIPFETGPLMRLSIAAPASEQAKWLHRCDPDYLLTYPSNLTALVPAMREAGLRPTRLREVVTMAELLPAETRALVREAWNVPIHDTYSAKEVGYMALQCPEHERLHIQSEVALVEVIDDAGRPCIPGEIGRVVATSLHNFAMPLIRYEIGDYAEVGPPCACGRGLPVLTRVMGRVRNILIGASGERYWPSFGTSGFRNLAPVRRHQFVQKRRDSLEARFVVERPLTADEEADLRAHILSRLPEPFEITFTYVDDIPPSEGGKLENFISEVAPPV
jgi:phenylacetate-CoA ligase